MVEITQEARELLESVLASNPSAVLVLGAERVVVAFNQQFVELLDLPESVWSNGQYGNLLKLTLERVVDPEDAERAVRTAWSDPSKPFSHTVVLRSGKFVEYESVPWRINGKYSGRVVTFHDVTEQKRAEEALRLSEARFRMIFEHAIIGMTLFDMDGKYVACNPAFCKMTGYTEEELKTIGVAGVSDPEEFPTNRDLLEDMKLGRTDQFELEKHYIRKDGSIIRGHLLASTVRNSAGLAWYGIGMTLDVTREKEVEESLRESREYLRNVLAHSPVTVSTFDLDGIFRLSEGKGLSSMGIKPGEMVGQSIFEIYAQNPSVIKDVKRALAGEEFVSLGRDPTGQTVWESRWSPLRDAHGTLQGVIAVSQNVTERERMARQQELLFRQEQRANQDARQAIQDRDEFMAIASHELRTPITPLKMQLQFLIRLLSTGKFANQPEAPDVLKIIQISEQQLDRLSRLIEDMLHATRMNATTLSLNREHVDLSELLTQAVDRYRPEASRLGCEIQLNLTPEIRGDWDRFRLDQVIVNLLTNAIKYGKGKPLEVTSARDGSWATFSVRDQGIGIDPHHHGKIFEQFHRVGPVNAYGGFGLGLYIARQIVAAHGGQITVQSKLGEGSTFTVELPLRALEK